MYWNCGIGNYAYIRDELYWVLHAPRQAGKTTFLQSWMREINAGGEAVACYVSVKRCQGLVEIERAMPAICTSIKERARKSSRGQPWIVNSLFKRATLQILDEDSAETVTREHIAQAREAMVIARDTHLDALVYRLKEPGVRSVIEPILTGEFDPDLAEGEAFRLCMDLGLVALEDDTPVIANPIYREIIARHLTYGQQLAISKPEWQWEKPDGSLDMDRILQEFQSFWRENSELWESVSKSWDERISWEYDDDITVLGC